MVSDHKDKGCPVSEQERDAELNQDLDLDQDPEDSESLDRCIQTALSALYPPFHATSPTVLCQVLSVVENHYRGDGLRYLIYFLLPAKQLLLNLQQDACVQYCGLLFRHEGWPLCIHEKVVVQLCPLDRHLLHPGDFYLLVSPPFAAPPPSRSGSSCCRSTAASCPHLLLCSVSAGSHHVEQQEVSGLALRSLFSMSWLDSVNRERERRGASRLERCLLSAHGDVFRVPWEDLVYPQFISRPQESSMKNGDLLMNETHSWRDLHTPTQDGKLLPPPMKTDQSTVSSEGEDSEGEYVELTELPLPLPRLSPQKGSLTQSISQQHRARTSTHTTAHTSAITHTATHTPASTHTATHTTANTPATHTTVSTHCSGPCVEISSHTGLCSRLIEENLSEDSCTPAILTPVYTTSPTSSSSCAPPRVVGTTSCRVERWTSQRQREGSESCRSLKLNTEPADCTEQREEQQEEEEQGREGETEGEKGEEQKVKDEVIVLVDEGEDKEEQLEDTECSRDEEVEDSDETEEELDELEEVEVEEEVQVIVVQQGQDKRQEKKVMKEEEREGGEEEEKEGRSEWKHTDEKADCTNTHTEDSYSENHTLQTHTESKTPAMDPDSPRTKPEESENGQKKQEERKNEQEQQEQEGSSCEEVGGGRTAELQTEGLSGELPPVQSHDSLSTGPSPTEPEPPAPLQDQSVAPSGPLCLTQSSQSHQSSFYRVLLSSGALCLPGTRDRTGRAVLTVCTRSAVWSNPNCDSAELLHLLLYYTSTIRKEVRALGLTVVVDARGAAPVPALSSALRSLQDNIPGSVHTVFLLVNKDSSVHVDKPAAVQVEVLSSLKSLHKQVEPQQLPAQFGGSLSFSQSSWLCFRSRVEQLTSQCEDVIKLLQKTINTLQATPVPAAAQDAELLLSRNRQVMRSVLEDSRLVQLQQEGGASLSRLRRDDSSLSGTEEQRVAVEAASTLYDEVDELLHRLVTLSNSQNQELSFILEFRSLERGFTEVKSWLQEVGEPRLRSLEQPEDSLELLNQKQQDFKDFHAAAYERCRQGEVLLSRLERWGDVSSADLQDYEAKVHSFWTQLQDFSQRVKTTGQQLERTVKLYRFLDQVYGWALEGMHHLATISMEECTLPDKCQAVIGCLEDYRRQHPLIPDAHFDEMRVVAGELRGERGLHQWSFAWSKCQETKKMFDRKMEAALRTRDSTHRQHSNSAVSTGSVSSRSTLSCLWGSNETSCSSCPPEDTSTSHPSTFSRPRNTSTLLPTTSTPAPPCSSRTPQHTPLLQRLFRSSSSEEASDGPTLLRLGSSSSSSFSSRRQQLRKTQSFDCPSTPEVSRYGPCPRPLSEPVRRGNTGVFIRGLEVSSTEAANHTLCPRMAPHGWAGHGLHSTGTPGAPRTTGSPAADSRPRGSKLRHVVEEMVTTEREYVRSLRYIIRHYFPEMDRADLPQDLRGKRSVVFGNLEKLLDFHSQFFLRELESCWKHPLRVPHCFLRHQEQFALYSLYSKNKPKSDALLANHGNSFFRRKQVELGDKMDLSSYLLKPVQRMSKYALLLTDLMKEVGAAQEAELSSLQAATDMVKFQLRHGNDLLAMDDIRDCDVNLKEQGQLIRQDEFTVWTRKRKCQRHVFLFEELILFSKHKKLEGGLDIFIYKHSFKTADVGLTESAGDNGLRFEIWFRRRTSKNQTFILQAATPGVKHAWTTDIARILWTQATRNKEMRLKEMVSMGVGNKPFLDIQPSDAAISDRAVHYMMKSRGARTRASIAVSVFDHSNPFKQGPVTSDPAASGPSSSSLLGPLDLHLYSQPLSSSAAAEGSFITSYIEEDEQEHETSSQPSMTTESSGSSSRCLSGSTGSDSGCVSSHLQETLPEEPGPVGHPSSTSSSSSSNKQHLSSQYISAKAAAVISPATIV